jgi:hypothetical protein
VQSLDGLIRLLPALPSAWPEGEVRGLRARGGFEVDIRWSGGRLREAVVRSVGGRETQVRYRDETSTLRLVPGQAVHLDGALARRWSPGRPRLSGSDSGPSTSSASALDKRRTSHPNAASLRRA